MILSGFFLLLQIYSGGKLGQRDFFAVELFDGVPYVVIDLGDRVHRFMLGRDERRVSDGSAHHVKVERSNRALILHLDEDEKSVNIISGQNILDLGICSIRNGYHFVFRQVYHLL